MLAERSLAASGDFLSVPPVRVPAMDVELLTESLRGSWDHTRPARDALVERGASAVGAVLDVLRDEQSPVEWTVSADVLCRIGGPAPTMSPASAGA